MSVVGANIVDPMTAATKEARPDICLDIFNQVSEMNRTIGIGESACDENISSVIVYQLK